MKAAVWAASWSVLRPKYQPQLLIQWRQWQEMLDGCTAVRARKGRRQVAHKALPGMQNLDFDFEKCCSVSLSPVNVYACLVCGKYFQGRGPRTHAYTHALECGHQMYMKLDNGKVSRRLRTVAPCSRQPCLGLWASWHPTTTACWRHRAMCSPSPCCIKIARSASNDVLQTTALRIGRTPAQVSSLARRDPDKPCPLACGSKLHPEAATWVHEAAAGVRLRPHRVRAGVLPAGRVRSAGEVAGRCAVRAEPHLHGRRGGGPGPGRQLGAHPGRCRVHARPGGPERHAR